jgi:SAM-dependent methyltransferase
MNEIYDHPKYYEIAFDFRDLVKEVDLFEQCFERYSRIPVRRVLELACGNCPHMIELIRRGYDYTGLDINPKMLAYSRQKATEAGVEPALVTGDMVDFASGEKFDFIYILLGSLQTKSNEQLQKHFDSVAGALKPGGLYFLDWCVQFENHLEGDEGVSWEMTAGSIVVKTSVSWKPVNLALQTFEENMRMDVVDNGRKLTFAEKNLVRAIYPQEFLLFIAVRPDFEFVGWWNLWDLEQPLEQAGKVGRPIILVRRTGA